MTSDFYRDELEPEQIKGLLDDGAVNATKIIEGLWHGNVLVRKNAARGVRYLSELNDLGLAMLKNGVKDTDVEVRHAIVTAVGGGVAPHPVGLPILFEGVLDANEEVRKTSIEGLERRLSDDRAAVLPMLVAALADVRAGVAATCARILDDDGKDDLLPMLVELLGSDNPTPRRSAFDILDQHKDAALDLLVEALRDSRTRAASARLLGGFRESAEALREKLAALSSDAEPALADAIDKIVRELDKPVVVVRTEPAVVPIPGFFERLLADDQVLGEAEVDEVLHASGDGRPIVRANAVKWLGLAEVARETSEVASRVLARLSPLMRDPEAVVRVEVARTAGALGEAEAIRALAVGLGDKLPAVREAAMTALVGLGPESLGPLLEEVRAGDAQRLERIYDGVRQVVGQLGAGAVQELADALRGERELTSLAREVACLALADLGGAAEDALPSLLLLLGDPAAEVRAAAATALGFIGLEDEIVLRDLKGLLTDGVASVRRQAALAAARITGRPLDDRRPAEPRVVPIVGFEADVLERDELAAGAAEAGVDLLVHALNDGREVVRQNAARALSCLAGQSGLDAAARPLAMLLRDGDVAVRRAAAEALRDIGKDALGAAWYLTGALADPDDEVREAVISALVGLHPECEEFLVEALRSDPAVADRGIFEVWYRLEGEGVPGLATALGDASGLIRANAARALERMADVGAADATGALEASLADALGVVRVAAQAALDAIEGGKPRPPKVLEPDILEIEGFYDGPVDDETLEKSTAAADPERIARQLRDGRAHVRSNAARLLRHYPGGDALTAALPGLAVLTRDEANEVQRAALSTLGSLIASEAAPVDVYGEVLVWSLGDRARTVRDAARTALEDLADLALPALLAGLEGSERVVAEVARLFAGTGEAGRGLLAESLAEKTPERHLGALMALSHFEREALTPLSELVDPLKKSTDPNVRKAALAVSNKIEGKDLIPVVLEPVPIPIDGFAESRMASEELAEGAAQAGLEPLVHALRDGRKIVRHNAALAIGCLGGAGTDGVDAAARPLSILLRDSDLDVRRAAALALKGLGKAALSVAPFIVGALADHDDEVREAVIAALAGLYPEAEDVLIDGLRVDGETAMEGIGLVWFALGGDAVPALIKAMNHTSALIRLNAVRTLELMAKEGASAALESLEDRLEDPVKQIQVAAEAAIDAIQGGSRRPPEFLEPDPIEIPGFMDGLVEDDDLLAHRDLAGPERLTRHLRDGRAHIRANAALLVGHHADSAEVAQALAGLAVLARDEAIEVRTRAVIAIGRLIAQGAAPVETYGAVLVRALSDREVVREAAYAALSDLGDKAFPALALGLATDDERTLNGLATLLKSLGDRALNALPDALSDLTPELHFGALTVLLAFPREGLEPYRPLVAGLMKSLDPAVHRAAGRLLDKIDGKDLLPAAAEPVPLPLTDFADGLMSREALEQAGGELRFDLLAHAITDGREIVRANAATGLGVLASADELAWPHLVRALKDPAAEVRMRAAESLAILQPRRDVAFDLVKRLDDRSPRVVAAAEAALAAYGEFALDAYMYALDDRPALVGRAILPMLASLGEQAIDKLVLAQRYDSPFVRLNAIIALRLLDRELAQRARLAVAQARKDEDREVRLEALRTLDWIDGVEQVFLREPRGLPSETFADESLGPDVLEAATKGYDAAELASLLFDGRRVVRENAARAHGVLHRFHPWLGLLLKDSVAEVQIAAAEALLQLGDEALPAARELISALLEDVPEVREIAKAALFSFGAKVLPLLIEGLWVPASTARKTVVPFIEALGAEATPTIIEALDHPSQLVVLNALQVLGRLYGTDPEGAVTAMDKVTALVRNPLPAIVGAAQKCLFRLEGRTPADFQKDPVPMPITGFDKGPLGVDTLKTEAPNLDVAWMISAFSDGRPIVRENAARATGFMPNALDDLLDPLARALKDAVPEVQVAAADAFANLLAKDEVAIPALTFALREATSRVKAACMTALEAYGPERVAAQLVKHLVGQEDWMLSTILKVTARMSEVMVPALAEFAKLEEESLTARENAVRVIGELGQKAHAAQPHLVELLPVMDGMLACKAAFALGMVSRPSKELIEAMEARLEIDPRPSFHLQVRQSLKILKRRMPRSG